MENVLILQSLSSVNEKKNMLCELTRFDLRLIMTNTQTFMVKEGELPLKGIIWNN